MLTPNANFSRKCEIPCGYATSYRGPESIRTENKVNNMLAGKYIQYKCI